MSANYPPEAPPEVESPSPATVTPHNREAEEATLGAVLINPDCYPELSAILKPADFYILRHGWIWQAFEELIRRGDPLDILTITNELTRLGQLEETGGPAYLTALINQVPTSLHAVAYARQVKDCAIKRRLVEAANKIATLAFDPLRTAEEVSARAMEAVQEAQPLKTDGRPRIVKQNAAFALQPRLPIEWLIEPIIGRGSVNLFYGEPGSKKTFSLLSMAVCVANGKLWLDMPTRAAKVLIIDEESGEIRLSLRLGDTLRGELADESTPLEFISLAGFHLDDLADVVLLENVIVESGAEFVIFDALADLMTGDENSKQDTQPVFSALRRLAERTGAAICIIHHSNKMGGYRGSSAIKGAVDLMVQITSEDGSDFINFKSEKNRDGEAISWAARCSWIKDPESFCMIAAPKPEKVKVLSKSQAYVIRYLTEHGASPLPAIMGAADVCSENSAKFAVYSLADLEKVRRTNPGGRPANYELTEKEN